MAIKTRMSAEERRQDILEAARYAFADRGLHGTSTEDIAKRAGISQPYIFRLFGTKKELFLASCEAGWQETVDVMQAAAVGKTGEEALDAMGQAYMDLLDRDPRFLSLQMEMYAAADDPDVREVARNGYGALVEFVERVSGRPAEEITSFFACGMLLNVMASMGLDRNSTGWAGRLLAGCPAADL